MGPSWKRFSSKGSLRDDNKYINNDGLRAARASVNPINPDNLLQEEVMSDIQQTIQDRDQIIEEQEQIIKFQQNNINELKEDEKGLRSQFWMLSDQLKESKAQVEGLQRHIATLEEQELSTRSNTIQILSNHNQALQKRVASLEHVVSVSSTSTGLDLQSILGSNAARAKSHEDLLIRFKEAEKSQEDSQMAIQALKFENEQLQSVVTEMRKDVSVNQISQPQTLRSLLILRFIEVATALPSSDEEISNEQQVARNWSPTGLPSNTFDKQCTPTEIQTLANLLPRGQEYNQFYSRLRLDFCSLCFQPKFRLKSTSRPDPASVKWLNEYLDSSKYFSCCFEKVCRDCFVKHLSESLQEKWWFKLGSLQWFSCPVEGCNECLGIRCEADLEIHLEMNCGVDAEEYVKMYVKAMAFRQALEELDPRPGDATLTKASQLTQHLVKTGRMYSLFDTRFDAVIADETGCIPDFLPGTLFNAVVESVSTPVPLFLKFLRRQTTRQKCMACSKPMFEIDYGDVDIWKTICEDFKGPWMWSVLVFPTSEIQLCDHSFEICKACTSEHIRGMIVNGGLLACDNLNCPQCRRQLSFDEVRQLTDTETIAKYDKFLLQKFLSKEPNFRWCLSPLCENGQLYQTVPHQNKTSCESCYFEMCFKHEVPWHEGLTCNEYESQREHGDPSFRETREWIRTNTKPCPGCQVGIQKGEACFHMTCSQCSYQFCWQCLGDWSEIRRWGQEGHAEGCFFRTHDVRPTAVNGENIEAVIQASYGEFEGY